MLPPKVQSDLLGKWDLLLSPNRNSTLITYLHTSHKRFITEATDLLKKRSLLNEVVVTKNVSSINIVGDLHGNWDCLKQAMISGKEPSETNLWIFNGDFVGSGAFSIDVLATLCRLLVEHPGCVFLNRGNNECARTSKECGFQECLRTVFGEEMGTALWGDCVSLFKHLPLASVVSFPDSDPTTTRSWFVTHSGILHPNASLSTIRNAERHDCSDATDVLKQLLWSRPSNENGTHLSAYSGGVHSMVWGPDISSEFVKVNEFSLIIRSHDSTDRGYSITHNGRVLTVFSSATELCPVPCFYRNEFIEHHHGLVPLPRLCPSASVLYEILTSSTVTPYKTTNPTPFPKHIHCHCCVNSCG
ncbi:serine/threonine protein phosphatase [Pelomyxa schiedti]|nr:serine/threonine protein phosphatase [Pelomyxa schiedti]